VIADVHDRMPAILAHDASAADTCGATPSLAPVISRVTNPIPFQA
jgi:hypothetical protein